jgi:hypothetical protein
VPLTFSSEKVRGVSRARAGASKVWKGIKHDALLVSAVIVVFIVNELAPAIQREDIEFILGD